MLKGILLALAHLKAAHLGLEVEENPFCDQEVNKDLSMQLEVPFDDSFESPLKAGTLSAPILISLGGDDPSDSSPAPSTN